MRKLLFVVAGFVVALSAHVAHPGAEPPDVAFHGIGDLPGPGGVSSAVRDATRVGGTIYAVGSSTVNSTAAAPAVPILDTAVLWTWTGSGSGTLEALPNLGDFTSTQTNGATAYAITPALPSYIASQARPTDSSNVRWVRVDRTLLPGTTANLDLSAPPGTPGFAALAISDSGHVIYGQRGIDGAVVRYQEFLPATVPDLTPTGRTWGYPAPRATSSDGLVMVGVAANGSVAPALSNNVVAFRYQHGDGTTVIPMLPGGTWNMPVALSADGNRTLVIGDSTEHPGGEVYFTNAANVVTEALGSPNTGMLPRQLGGMTADGSAVAVTFSNANLAPGLVGGAVTLIGNRHAYIHNSQGWFHFSTILAAHDVDLSGMGWDPANMAITGIRTVDGVDLVFGQGRRRTVGDTGYVLGALEGFVVELQPHVLRDFDLAPSPPGDQSIVGAWTQGNPANPAFVVAFQADGTFVGMTPLGFERGVYTWAGNAAGGAFTVDTLHDTNTVDGVSPRSGQLGRTLIVTGDTLTVSDTYCPSCAPSVLTRIVGGPNSIVGGWMTNDGDHEIFLALLSSGTFFLQADFPSTAEDFLQRGTYAWNSATHELSITPIPAVPGAPFSLTAALTSDEQGLVVTDPVSVNILTRVMAATSTTLTSSPNPATYGQAVTLTATVSSAAGVPAGSVTFFDGGTPLGTATVDGNGRAILAVSTLSAGTHELSAKYGGDYSHLNVSTGNLSQSITTATTTTTLVSSPNPSSPGQTVNFIATIAGQYGGSVSGNVTFTKGANPIGTATVAADGTATLSLTSLGTGPHVVVATYEGDANSLGSASPPATHNVVAPASRTTTMVSSSLNPSIAGQEVTFTVVVTSNSPGTPTGTVTLRRGQTTLDTVALTNGQASYSTSSLPAGSLGITADYSGDAQFIASSASLTQVVNKASTTTALTSSPNPSTFGDPVTFTAAVTASTGAIPTGVVELVEGNVTLGSATLVNGSATFIISNLSLKKNGSAATHNIKAKYLGDAGNQNSTSNTVAQTVR